MTQLEQERPARVYSDAVYELYDSQRYTDQDIRHDAWKIEMLRDLWHMAFHNVVMWRNAHPNYTGEEEKSAYDRYFGMVFEPFWDIASEIKLWLEVLYEDDHYSRQGKGSMLKPDVEADMRCFSDTYNVVRRLIQE